MGSVKFCAARLDLSVREKEIENRSKNFEIFHSHSDKCSRKTEDNQNVRAKESNNQNYFNNFYWALTYRKMEKVETPNI